MATPFAGRTQATSEQVSRLVICGERTFNVLVAVICACELTIMSMSYK